MKTTVDEAYCQPYEMAALELSIRLLKALRAAGAAVYEQDADVPSDAAEARPQEDIDVLALKAALEQFARRL